MSTDKVKLQLNTSGAWKDVASFDEAQSSEVVQALDRLDRAVGRGAIRWCLVDLNGVRSWLTFEEKAS